ncbi:MAG: hypothetical protein IT335_06615 [Thermomicrobiales bacterium]|nr:hypothetical protein [Thermomicrobiales bacterium]
MSNTLAKPELLKPYRVLTLVTAVLVLLQAFFAGQWIFKGNADLLDLHEIMANVLFLGLVVQFFLATMIRFPGQAGRVIVGANALMVLLTTAQIGLGYSGSNSADARAWHVPLGVLLFGLAIAIASYSWRPTESN